MQYATTPGFKSKLANFYKPISTREKGYRPPGARFFLLQRRKNRGRKTPLRCPLTHCGSDLMAFLLGWKSLRLNFYHAKGLAPSGGHILSSPAKKEYGKKDAAQGGGPRPTDPPPWVGVGGAGGYVSTTRQTCLRSSLQGTDAPANLPGTPYRVRHRCLMLPPEGAR